MSPRAWCLLLVLAGVGGCGDALQSLGVRGAPSPRAEQLFGALADRVTYPWRDLKYDSARIRIARHAVIPSRLWRDTSVWTAMADSRRQLLVHGHFNRGRYAMESSAIVAPPDELAEARHVIELTRLSDDLFRWDTDVPFAIGTVPAADIGAMFASLFAAAEGRAEASVREDYRRAMPRTTGVAGQLFRIDSIRTTMLPDRSTSATFAITITPGGIEERYPQLAKYLRRYVHTARIRLALVDSTARGTTEYLRMALARGQFTMQVRTAGRRLLALSGPPVVMPDSLTLAADVTVRVSRFTVGVRNYRGDFRIVSTEGERAWEVISRREPDWVLPLFTETLLRAPLKRPFAGDGALFRIGVRDSAGAQSLLYRTLRLEVQESAILRFLARLGAVAMDDYAGDVEEEEMAWLSELFTAMLADLRSAANVAP